MWLLAAAALLAATVASAQPARVGCGPAQAGCGPAALGVPGVAPPIGTAAPSWVASTLAAWMLDETSGTRVNLQGTTSRDLATVDGSDPTSSTDHQEGTRSMSVASPQARHTTDTFATLISPIAYGCWVKMAANPPGSDVAVIMHYFNAVAGMVRLDRTSSGAFKFTVWDAAVSIHTVTSAVQTNNVWHHAVGTAVSGGVLTLYLDGVSAGTTAMGTGAAVAQPIYVGDNLQFVGLIDECFVANVAVSAASVCRICSCGIRGEQCTCAGTTFATTGRNASACGSCTLPADCSAAAPS